MAITKHLYSDLDLRFNPNPVTGDVSFSYDDQAVIRSVKNLLQTRPFERLFQPELSSQIDSETSKWRLKIAKKAAETDAEILRNEIDFKLKYVDDLMSLLSDYEDDESVNYRSYFSNRLYLGENSKKVYQTIDAFDWREKADFLDNFIRATGYDIDYNFDRDTLDVELDGTIVAFNFARLIPTYPTRRSSSKPDCPFS